MNGRPEGTELRAAPSPPRVLAELEEGAGEGEGEDGPSAADRRALAGRVAAARGEGERAVELLAAARRDLEQGDRPVAALLTTLDLASALHATGGKAELGRLAEELADLEGPPEVTAVLPDDRSRLRSGELSRRRAAELTRALLVERQLAR